MGAVILPLMALYLGLLVWATWYGGHWAAKRGWQGKKRWLGAAIGFLLVYLPVFWDWIPTVVAHKYYCGKEAGSWVYKTPEQWKAENPGVMEILSEDKKLLFSYENFNNGYGEKSIYFLNDHFQWIVIQEDISRFFPIIRREEIIKDARSDEILAQYVNFATGNSVELTIGPPGPLKFWLKNQSCGPQINDKDIFLYKIIIRGVGK